MNRAYSAMISVETSFYRLFSLFRSYYTMVIALVLYSLCACYAYSMHNYEQIHRLSNFISIAQDSRERELITYILRWVEFFWEQSRIFIPWRIYIYNFVILWHTCVHRKIICKGNKMFIVFVSMCQTNDVQIELNFIYKQMPYY